MEQAQMASQFECMVCKDSCEIHGSYELECGHRLCSDCFVGYVKSKVDGGRVSANDLRCPHVDEQNNQCQQELSYDQIVGVLSEEDKQKFLRFRLEQYQPGDNEMKVTCPSPDCVTYIIDKTATSVKCAQCGRKFCPHCLEEAHEGSTCEEYRRWKEENSQGDGAFNRLAEREGFRRCPVCGVMCEKVRGCNFMTCESIQCKANRVHFCYICGQQLTRADHYTHFGVHGPFGDGCVIVPNPQQARPYIHPDARVVPVHPPRPHRAYRGGAAAAPAAPAAGGPGPAPAPGIPEFLRAFLQELPGGMEVAAAQREMAAEQREIQRAMAAAQRDMAAAQRQMAADQRAVQLEAAAAQRQMAADQRARQLEAAAAQMQMAAAQRQMAAEMAAAQRQMAGEQRAMQREMAQIARAMAASQRGVMG